MGIPAAIAFGTLYLVGALLDIVIAFLIVRLMTSIVSYRLVLAFDVAGARLVGEVSNLVHGCWLRVAPKKPLPGSSRIRLALAVVIALRLLVTVFLGLLC